MFYHLSHWPVWNSGFSGDSWLVWKHTKMAFRHVPPTAKVTASWVRPTSCTSLKTKGWLYLKILEKVGWPKRKSENLSGAINFFLCFQVWGIHNTTTCKLGLLDCVAHWNWSPRAWCPHAESMANTTNQSPLESSKSRPSGGQLGIHESWRMSLNEFPWSITHKTLQIIDQFDGKEKLPGQLFLNEWNTGCTKGDLTK